jgi:hypothetical protein
MEKIDSRRISTLDLMVLVAAAAAGLWLKRHSPPYLWPGGSNVGPESTVFRTWGCSLDVFPFLIPLAPALVVLHLRRPHPSLGRLTLRPGFAACLAATLGLAPGTMLQTLREVVAAMTQPGAIVKLPSPPFVTTTAPAPGAPEPMATTTNCISRILLVPLEECHAPAVATAVVVTWAILAVGRRWWPEPTWLDRAGRLLGLAWISAAAAVLASAVLGDVMM